MKKVFSLLIIFSLFIVSCEKEDNNNRTDIEITLSEFFDNEVNEGDTVSVLRDQLLVYRVWTDESKDEFTWDFGDNSNETGGYVRHLYEDNGVFTITLSKNNNICFTFYVKVYGHTIKKSEEEYEGVYLSDKIGLDQYIITYKENGHDLFIHKMIANVEESCLQPNDGFFCCIQRVQMDNNNNFIILSDDRFCKVDLTANTLFEKSFQSDHSFEWHIYENSRNEYLFTGVNSSEVIMEKWSGTGVALETKQLYNNEDQEYKGVDCLFLNDYDYLILQNNRESYASTESVKLIQRNLLNDNEIKLIIPNSYYRKIIKTESGFLLVAIDIDWNCSGCTNYLNIAKISPDLEMEWNQEFNINIYENYFVDLYNNYFYRYNNILNFIELSDSYMFFYTNNLLKINKSGERVVNKKYFDPNFIINSALMTDDKIEILGTVENDIYTDNSYRTVKIPSLISVDLNGVLVN